MGRRPNSPLPGYQLVPKRPRPIYFKEGKAPFITKNITKKRTRKEERANKVTENPKTLSPIYLGISP